MLLAVGLSSVGALRRAHVQAAEEKLSSLALLVRAHPPQINNSRALRDWTAWFAASGVRITVISSDGAVLADSQPGAGENGNPADEAEIQQALSNGEGRAVRRGGESTRDSLYLAVREQGASGKVFVIRLSEPIPEIDPSLAPIRRRLWIASLAILFLGIIASFVFTRAFSRRVATLKDFSRRVAQGDFRPLSLEPSGDELEDLAVSLNETAARLNETIQSLTEERNRSSAILGSMEEGVAVMDSSERLIFCNPAFSSIVNVDGARALAGHCWK